METEEKSVCRLLDVSKPRQTFTNKNAHYANIAAVFAPLIWILNIALNLFFNSYYLVMICGLCLFYLLILLASVCIIVACIPFLIASLPFVHFCKIEPYLCLLPLLDWSCANCDIREWDETYYDLGDYGISLGIFRGFLGFYSYFNDQYFVVTIDRSNSSVKMEIGNYTDIFGLFMTLMTFTFLKDDGKISYFIWQSRKDWTEKNTCCIFTPQLKMEVILRNLTVQGTEDFLNDISMEMENVNKLIKYYTDNDAEMLQSWKLKDSDVISYLENIFPASLVHDELLPFLISFNPSLLRKNEFILIKP